MTFACTLDCYIAATGAGTDSTGTNARPKPSFSTCRSSRTQSLNHTNQVLKGEAMPSCWTPRGNRMALMTSFECCRTLPSFGILIGLFFQGCIDPEIAPLRELFCGGKIATFPNAAVQVHPALRGDRLSDDWSHRQPPYQPRMMARKIQYTVAMTMFYQNFKVLDAKVRRAVEKSNH